MSRRAPSPARGRRISKARSSTREPPEHAPHNPPTNTTREHEPRRSDAHAPSSSGVTGVSPSVYDRYRGHHGRQEEEGKTRRHEEEEEKKKQGDTFDGAPEWMSAWLTKIHRRDGVSFGNQPTDKDSFMDVMNCTKIWLEHEINNRRMSHRDAANLWSILLLLQKLYTAKPKTENVYVTSGTCPPQSSIQTAATLPPLTLMERELAQQFERSMAVNETANWLDDTLTKKKKTTK